MVQILATLLSLIAVGFSFFSHFWPWVPLGLAWIVVCFFLVAVKQKWAYIPELSPEANSLIQKHGHFYKSPLSSADFSAACSGMMFAAVAVGVVSGFRGWWWALCISAFFYISLAVMARIFNPVPFFSEPWQTEAHQEVVTWISSERGK